jgi:hypothetical protein
MILIDDIQLHWRSAVDRANCGRIIVRAFEGNHKVPDVLLCVWNDATQHPIVFEFNWISGGIDQYV